MNSVTQTADFGELNSLRELFLDAKKLRSARHPAHVLLVEDDPITRRIVASALSHSHAVIAEESAKGAVASYLQHAPDIVLLDIGLPDINGFCVLDQIMTLDPDAFVVMFSSRDDTNSILKAHVWGAKGYISKPFKKETLHYYIQLSNQHYHKS